MAGATRYLQNRDGRFFARLVVPKDLRKIIGKTELRSSLGPDRRTAMKHLPGAVAVMQDQLARAERQLAASGAKPIQFGRYPLAPDQIAARHYARRLAFDEELRQDHRYASFGYIDEIYVADLRNAIAGKLSDPELQALMGEHIERFRYLGNHTAEPGSDEWRTIARKLAVGELEALARVAERDEGDFTGKPEHPLIANAQPPEDEPDPVSLSKLWNDYIKARTTAGFMKDGGRRQRPVIDSLRKFLKHNDARRITRKDLLAWRDHLMSVDKLSARTVSGIYLSTIRSLLGWACENELLAENVAATVKQAKPRRVQRTREAGYTDAEAVTVLKASRSYQAKADEFGYVRETPHSVAAKQWVPLLCAHTGARVSEITQLRKEDIRKEGDRWVIRISPDAGSTKTGQWRDVPLHRQVVAEGFNLRDNLARSILLKQAAALIDGDQLTEVAREMANEQMAEMGVMPESCRESMAAGLRLEALAKDHPTVTMADLGVTLPEPVKNVINISIDTDTA
ncbi:hypothetical protein SAMN05421772_1197 [Paracoccus saliphilus]|uniref:DUF6538 domain-containing protein n=1 Tax=Paracoccus saliphilus TaxID=405559 RepID=A0AA45W7M1_9RHOB|nr:hypothetical protein SAMN05421772_1197 [Paracoccus saliphilus]